MDFKNVIGLGVAGNFAGHLEQAGEASDFKAVVVKESHQPKAIFPFYVPSTDSGFLSSYPISHNQLNFPENADNLQIEPEIAILCDIQYDANFNVVTLEPKQFAAYNDCSIRRPNAKKICEKKNWGESSKGISSTMFPLSSFESGSNIDNYRIACFHKRDNQLTEYGIDSAAVDYSYFHQQLIEWIIDRMNNQPDEGPMNNIRELLTLANHPKQALISIGATRYTPFGETNFLQPGDTSIVVVYNGNEYTPKQVETFAMENQFPTDISALVQEVK